MTPGQLQTYRRLRRDGWSARYALQFVRDDARVDELESDEWIRFDWRDDSEWWAITDETERKMIQEGRWEAAGCVAEIPSRDPIGWPTGQWEHAASLWGIVGPFDCSDRDYRRSVELDLAREARLL